MDRFDTPTFVNADIIARGLSGFRPEETNLEAGRILLDRLSQLAERKADFAFETTLAGFSYAQRLKSLREAGYRVCLVYLWLVDAALNVARVTQRVQVGGHDVPEVTIRQRWTRSLQNFFSVYREYADVWEMYENSTFLGPKLIASEWKTKVLEIGDETLWQSFHKLGSGTLDKTPFEMLPEHGTATSLTRILQHEMAIHKALDNPVSQWDGEKVMWSS